VELVAAEIRGLKEVVEVGFKKVTSELRKMREEVERVSDGFEEERRIRAQDGSVWNSLLSLLEFQDPEYLFQEDTESEESELVSEVDHGELEQELIDVAQDMTAGERERLVTKDREGAVLLREVEAIEALEAQEDGAVAVMVAGPSGVVEMEMDEGSQTLK
jgi:hypothetical protein